MRWIAFLLVGALFTSCQNNKNTDQVVSQTFVHKYGFDVSEKEWEERAKEGKVVTMLKNGVKVTRSYEGGQLHGSTVYTFPNSTIVEKELVYDQGVLLRETVNDPSGMPIREEMFEFDNRKIITLWDEKGVPLSVEEYKNDLLVEGKYYTPEHVLESKVEGGFGQRVKRDRAGLLISRDEMENGIISARTTYHPNGQEHTVSHYSDYQLHGEQLKFTSTGRPLMELNWNHGVLDGTKVVYRNGYKIAEIPFVNGKKHGLETHYDDLGNLTAEIEWRDDKKHGLSKVHTEESSETEWFFNGQSVNAEKFKNLLEREQINFDFEENVAR